ncbi:hypothetical protein FQN54_000291 [Arachnomyces sp. PD_36]|nr:hypothetical protein FQN54_000291 [Arachnomyces sp. PD_36]
MAESPAQEAARLRRERREAKIKAGGSARLDKITSLSGRTASTMESSPTPPTERVSPQPSPSPQPHRPIPSPSVQDDNIQSQEEYLRALLRSQQPPPNQSPQSAPEDPTAKLLSTLLGSGGMPMPPEAAGGLPPGAAPPPGGANQNPLGDLSSATGLPPFLTDMLMGQSSAPKTAAELRNERILKVLHVVFSLVVGVYLLSLIQSSVQAYGSSPPPPATAQNPFTVFVMGEAMLLGLDSVLGGKKTGGRGMLGRAMGAVQVLRGLVRDGGIAVFVIGVGTWWMGGSQG